MALTGGTISAGLLDAFNEGGRWYVAYPTIAPIMPVTERGGTLQVLPVSASTPGDGFNINKTAGAAYTQASGAYTGVAFTTQPVGVEAAIDRSFRLPETAAIDAARQCRRLVDTVLELTAADAALAISDGFPAVPAGVAWNATNADPDPAKDVAAAAAVIRAATGMYPNVLVVSGWAWETLLGSPVLRDRLALSVTRGPAEVERALGALLGVERVVRSTVMGGSVPAAMWPDTTAWVGVCALPGDPPSEPSAMRLAAWTGEGADENGWVVETYYDERTRSDYVRVRGNLGLVTVSKKLGCRITGIKTTT